jgi:GNAT superfamily N-acetyltransferase
LIRVRTEADLERCAEALRTVHDADRYPLNWPAGPRAWLAPAIQVRAWVAEDPDGTITGHVAIHREPGELAELSRLFVVPAARRRRLAGELVRTALHWAVGPVTLNVPEDGRRTGAVAFYEATGWRFTHTATADWTSEGRPVRLRHHRSGEWNDGTGPL